MTTMTDNTPDTTPSDLAGTRASLSRIWGIPIGMAFIGGFWHAGAPVLWPISFLWIGAACSANALRCRRVHCTIMGPTFLVLGLLSALTAVGALALSWSLLGGVGGAPGARALLAGVLGL